MSATLLYPTACHAVLDGHCGTRTNAGHFSASARTVLSRARSGETLSPPVSPGAVQPHDERQRRPGLVGLGYEQPVRERLLALFADPPLELRERALGTGSHAGTQHNRDDDEPNHGGVP